MSKDLQLVALGNALVDVEIQVNDQQLLATGLRKGGMTLADAQQQEQLLKMFESQNGQMSSGGSAANTVIAFAQFGGRTAYKSVLGADSMGEFYADEFVQLGVELFAERSSIDSTGTCVVLVTPDAERTMQTSLGVNMRYSRDHIMESALRRADWFYIEGYKLTDDSGVEAIDESQFYARKHGVLSAVTFSDTFIVNGFRSQVEQVCKHVDMVFCNESEALAFADTDSTEDAYRALCSRFSNVAMTMGVLGSRVRIGSQDFEIPAYASNVISTNGAGDMYAGAFLYGICHRWGPEKSGHLASLAASKVIAQHGARLNSSHVELRDSFSAGLPKT